GQATGTGREGDADMATLAARLESLAAERDHLRESLSATEAERDRLAAGSAAGLTADARLREALVREREERAQLTSALGAARAALSELQASLSRRDAEVKEQAAELERLRAEQERLAAAREAAPPPPPPPAPALPPPAREPVRVVTVTPPPAARPPAARPRVREIEAGRRPLVVIDVEDRWCEKALDGHHVEVVAPGDDLAEQIGELSPARIVVNLLAPGALGALVAARAAGCGSRFWGCLANSGADRALMLGMVEAAESPIDPDEVVATLERYAARGTRVVTVGTDVDALMSLRQALARKGLSVSMAWDAKQAADLLQVVRPEVVVVDLALPRRDGYGIVARLAALDPPPSAILVPGPDDAAVAFAAALADSASAGGALQLGQLLAAVLARSEAPPIERRHKIRVVARLRSLGGVPGARPSRELAALCGVVADPGVSDRSKLALLLGRLPAREDAPLGELVRRAEGDAETRALLETIVDDERATVRWLRGMRDALEREGA